MNAYLVVGAGPLSLTAVDRRLRLYLHFTPKFPLSIDFSKISY